MTIRRSWPVRRPIWREALTMVGRGPWTDGEPHNCPVPGCHETVHRFICRRHWAALPKAIRDDLWRAWRSGTGVDTVPFALAVESALAIARLSDSPRSAVSAG